MNEIRWSTPVKESPGVSLLKSMRGYIRLNKERNKEIVFYSEGKRYWINFKDVVARLCEDHRQIVHYVTSSPDDPVLRRETEFFKPRYIGNELFRILFFQTLEARVFITTLPDVGTYHLKRSPKVRSLVFIPHCLGSYTMVSKGYDCYDAILCHAMHTIKELRDMEAYHGIPARTLVKAGYPPLDDLIERVRKHGPRTTARPVVTIAPSWHTGNLMDNVAPDLVQSLLDADLLVRLRPHPQTLEREGGKVRRLADIFAQHPGFALDETPGSFDSYVQTDLMVTDWSNTAVKFALACLRPVLFINTPMKIINPDYDKYASTPVEIAWRRILGAELDVRDIGTAGTKARALLADTSWAERLEKFRSETIFNVGHSAGAIADALVQLVRTGTCNQAL